MNCNEHTLNNSTMNTSKEIQPPKLDLTLIAITYCCLLAEICIGLFNLRYGATGLINWYLILGAPVIMGMVLYRTWDWRNEVQYYRLAFRSAWLYFILAPLLFILLRVF